jgi:hypothetical protein
MVLRTIVEMCTKSLEEHIKTLVVIVTQGLEDWFHRDMSCMFV